MLPSQQLPAKPKRPQLNRSTFAWEVGQLTATWHPHRQGIMTPVRWKGLLVIFKTMRAWAWDEMTGSWMIYLLRHPVPTPEVWVFGTLQIIPKTPVRRFDPPKGLMFWCQLKFHVYNNGPKKKSEHWRSFGSFHFLEGSPFCLTNFIHKHVSTKIFGRNWTSRRYRKLKDFFCWEETEPQTQSLILVEKWHFFCFTSTVHGFLCTEMLIKILHGFLCTKMLKKNHVYIHI